MKGERWRPTASPSVRHRPTTKPPPSSGGRWRSWRSALTIDHGWQKVADTALAFVQKYARPERSNQLLDGDTT